MERVTDWAKLWADLVGAFVGPSAAPDDTEVDHWKNRARHFDTASKRRRLVADPLREFVMSRLGSADSVLDIGAGTGRWAVAMAKRVRRVTAVERSAAMLQILRENLEAEGIKNVDVVQGSWPEVDVEPHDVSLCSHAMYAVRDLPGFVRQMNSVTRKSCYLLVKSPTVDGVMADAARRVWGHRHDCPSFDVAFNVLLDMGLCPNAMMDPSLWRPWTSESLEEALAEIKKRLGVEKTTEHDGYLADLLSRRLTREDGRFVWPKGIRNGLIYWDLS